MYVKLFIVFIILYFIYQLIMTFYIPRKEERELQELIDFYGERLTKLKLAKDNLNNYYSINKLSDDEATALNEILSKIPAIRKYYPYCSTDISRRYSLEMNLENIHPLYLNLFEVHEQMVYSNKHKAHIKHALEQTFLLPANLFKWFGFSFKKITSKRILSALIWIIGMIIKYKNELFTFFKNFML